MEPITIVHGGVSVLDRDDVDTDQIIPKQFLKRVERTGFGQFLFHDWAQEPGWELPRNPILAAGRNFGCGSSREHAPWALQDYGFRAVVAPSFADIFYSNCTKIGLLPVVLPEETVKALMAEGEAAIDLEAQDVEFAGRTVSFEIEPDVKHRLRNGLDDIGMTLERAEDVDRYERDRERSGP
ncbi:MAG: 3-isopropylmalate dehydratase small subunit, partial [Actinomycetota bacterium]|nr:3-isopropylmalate dehydratase small subunit [Actinomycetota bacterium]